LIASSDIYLRLLMLEDILSECDDHDFLNQLNKALDACRPNE